MTIVSGLTAATPEVYQRTSDDGAMRRLAGELESTFLAEMLGHAGLGAAGQFAGGIGEEQFASFLRREQAGAMVRAGGIGLAESLFLAMKGTENGAG